MDVKNDFYWNNCWIIRFVRSHHLQRVLNLVISTLVFDNQISCFLLTWQISLKLYFSSFKSQPKKLTGMFTLLRCWDLDRNVRQVSQKAKLKDQQSESSLKRKFNFGRTRWVSLRMLNISLIRICWTVARSDTLVRSTPTQRLKWCETSDIIFFIVSSVLHSDEILCLDRITLIYSDIHKISY